MQDIFLIGGSPSSGSTLLVNLLNRNKNLVCLPETGLFVHGRNLIDLSADIAGHNLGWHLPWLLTGVKVTKALGWSENEYDNAHSHYPTAFEFLRSRIDPDRKYWLIEKTPENIFAFEQYLGQSKKNRVIVTSRDALSVVQSLMRRGFNMLEGMLAWFAHSYESAQLMANYPSQVYHCAYDRLTREPEEVASEVVHFLGIKDAPPAVEEQPEIDLLSVNSSQGSSDVNEIYANTDSIQMLLEISSWGLTDTSWLRSPAGVAQHSKPVNLIGLDYDMLMDRIVFNTPSRDLVRLADVENSLSGSGNKLVTEAGLQCEELKAHYNSSYTRCLAEHYSPAVLRI
jgi:hypothetical protein